MSPSEWMRRLVDDLMAQYEATVTSLVLLELGLI
jgi:hypothetical protein